MLLKCCPDTWNTSRCRFLCNGWGVPGSLFSIKTSFPGFIKYGGFKQSFITNGYQFCVGQDGTISTPSALFTTILWHTLSIMLKGGKA